MRFIEVKLRLQDFHNPVLSSFMTYHRVGNESNTTGVTYGAGTAYPSASTEFTPWCLVGFVLLDL